MQKEKYKIALENFAKNHNYKIHPDTDLDDFVDILIENKGLCPCREVVKCPCDCHDIIKKNGMCSCGLFVNEEHFDYIIKLRDEEAKEVKKIGKNIGECVICERKNIELETCEEDDENFGICEECMDEMVDNEVDNEKIINGGNINELERKK